MASASAAAMTAVEAELKGCRKAEEEALARRNVAHGCIGVARDAAPLDPDKALRINTA